MKEEKMVATHEEEAGSGGGVETQATDECGADGPEVADMER